MIAPCILGYKKLREKVVKVLFLSAYAIRFWLLMETKLLGKSIGGNLLQ